ncbi:uncharacterized protein LOC119128632 [Syngnathus acus]|uniref:uncharacterized protein LOC119128632 n=1 Tax=Syngnathus acus TaxID=161584 RepID=UPI001885D444|nr:uncharacterized protein LOC119128632 [Syngnathus acus]
MKPVTCQSFPSTKTGQPHGYLVRTPRFLDTMHCSKCGFATSDMDLFKRHMLDHMGSKLFCFYCHKAVLSKAELYAHLEEHSKSTFTCPHCGQQYLRKVSLLQHIACVHNKNISQAPKKVGDSKDPQASNALLFVQSAEHSTRPPVQVNVPSHSTPTGSLVKDGQKSRTMNTMLPICSNGVPDSFIHHNRALTVSLPEEVSIPVGCMVEFVEVKTVNGSKELKLRLVSKQENDSEVKDTRTTVQQNVMVGKTLASKLNHPSAVKSTNMGMCNENRKQLETKPVGQQRAAGKPFNTSKSLVSGQASQAKVTLKRTPQEVINLDSPTKVSKTVYTVRERNEIVSKQHEPVHNQAKATNALLNRETRILTRVLQPVLTGSCASQQRTDERLSIPDKCKSIPPSKAVLFRDTSTSVVCLNDNAGSKVKETLKVMNTPAGVNQPSHKSTSSNVRSDADIRVLRAEVGLCQESATPRSPFPGSVTVQKTACVTPSVEEPVVPCRSKSDNAAWPQGVCPSKCASERDTPKPEGFPIISSVFSLSEGDDEGAMKPLVMALRGIVMDKSNTAEKLSPDVNCEARLETNRTCGSVKVEVAQQQPSVPVLNDSNVDVKLEKTNSTQTDNPGCNPNLKSENEELVPDNSSNADAFATVNGQYDLSKFLTVSLTRVDERGVWMNSGNESEPSALQEDVPIVARDTGHLMPLKAEQPVTLPGPNQPVVVLNHPKPRVPIQETVHAVANTGIPEKAPKCQILKMRLGKVMGQKYEVTGCTVRFSQ